MKKTLLLLLYAFISVSMSAQSMKIWKDGTAQTISIANIDSVTFDTLSSSQPDVDVVVPDVPYSSDENLQQALSAVYLKFVNFYQSEQQLEKFALGIDNKNNVISPQSSYISTCWANGYYVVTMCNNFIKTISSSGYSFNPEKYIFHFQCLRELTLYMMTQLWGDIPAPDKIYEANENIYETSRQDIIGRAYSCFNAYREALNDTKICYLNSQNMLPLMREMEIELNRPHQYNYNNLDASFVLCIDGNNTELNVVDNNSWSILMKEKADETNMDTFANELTESFGQRYGIWRALVRIGKATANNGMASSLFFPKPQSEIDMNPNEHQNEGY